MSQCSGVLRGLSGRGLKEEREQKQHVSPASKTSRLSGWSVPDRANLMPSPIGHALAGIAAGSIIAPPRPAWRSVGVRAAIYGVAAASPDLDLLFNAHSGPTHGLGAALIVAVAVWSFMRWRALEGAGRTAFAVGAAYASHTLLDWLGIDTSPPVGIMALWPFSHAYYESDVHVFLAISRRYWLPEFWTSNLLALARELLILVPIVWIVIRYRRQRVHRNPSHP